MEKPVIVGIIVIFLLLAAAGCVSAPVSPQPAPSAGVTSEARPHYVIGVDGDFYPFTYQGSDRNFTGHDIEAARWVAGREGFDVSFVALPWTMVIPSLQEGKIDMIWSAMTVTAERQEKFVNFSKPYYTVNHSVAIRTGSGFTLQNLYDGRLRIGTQENSPEGEWVKETLIRTGKMPEQDLLLYPDITSLTAALGNGTVDATIIEYPSQQWAIRGKPLQIIGATPGQTNYAVAVRKTDPDLLAKIDDGLMQLMKDPYWQQLKQKYGMA